MSDVNDTIRPAKSSILKVIPRERPIYIYVLIDPFTAEVRYIGKTDRPKARLANHCNDKTKCHRTNWIQSIIRKGKKPIMRILQQVPFWARWQDAERMWIRYGFDRLWPLTNSTMGGDGVEGVTGEGKERMLAAWKGRKHKPESLKKIGDASRGRKHSEAYKARMRKLMSERTFSEEHRRKLSQTQWKRLPDDKRKEIERRLADGERVIDIAAAMGVHRMTVSKIKNHKKN